jgi:predicted RNase H-like nuclease (RuvC/YqgF family)
MGESKHLRNRIRGLSIPLQEHLETVSNLNRALERSKPNPDEGLITHWNKEVRAWQHEIQRLEQRLKRKR